MYDLGTFSVEDKVGFARELRECGASVATVDEAAECVVRFFRDNLVDAATGQPACVLARLYVTRNFEELDAGRREFVLARAGELKVSARTKCLCLLATAGDEPEWNSVDASVGHRVIPLPSEEIVRQSPMISQLIQQLGLEINTVLTPDPEVIGDLSQREYNIFFVPVAQNSPYIPAQEEFVVPYRVKSALGFGGLLPTGDLFAVILFSRVFLSPEVALTFKTFALTVKGVLLSAGLPAGTAS